MIQVFKKQGDPFTEKNITLLTCLDSEAPQLPQYRTMQYITIQP